MRVLSLPGAIMKALAKLFERRHHVDLSHIEFRLHKMEIHIMATLLEVQAKIVAIAADIAAEKNEVQALLTDLKAQIKVLTDQIGTGTVVTAADLQGLVDSLNAIEQNVKDISEPVVPV